MYRKPKSQMISDAVCGVLMLVSILVYLLIGVIANIWHPTWIIVVSAGLICGIISICVGTFNNVSKSKELDNDTNKTE